MSIKTVILTHGRARHCGALQSPLPGDEVGDLGAYLQGRWHLLVQPVRALLADSLGADVREVGVVLIQSIKSTYLLCRGGVLVAQCTTTSSKINEITSLPVPTVSSDSYRLLNNHACEVAV